MRGVVEIETLSFCNCPVLSELEFDKLEIIGEYAFALCKSLVFINMPSVRRVGEYTFNGCDSLRRISIPLKDNLIIEYDAFNDCYNLSRVDTLVGDTTISSLHLESWRDEMQDEIDRINQTLPNTPVFDKTTAIQEWITSVLSGMEHYKSEHQIILKEAATLLELALWKANLRDDVAAQEGVRVTRGRVKKARKDRCITSGASIVIKNVLTFLVLK